jgi:hypothetical protein
MTTRIARRRQILLSHLDAKVWWMGGCTDGTL